MINISMDSPLLNSTKSYSYWLC